ncbi:lipopolysaccharide biosynthesis glycosyltransferase [Pedobacter sp. AK017]|uniref:glycosyltransferase family 8 protein n=1 Tax=Pedobacter sp. AK017 TaxID=2723073 RepID=UPI0016101469|nr:glycosyltransferase family 8 protein [Pedobacter sp. AK017]MBB5436373.1 lipopolysaccharide biosynthesis glycosyltransferase [Pedobacter sp. AK017]
MQHPGPIYIVCVCDNHYAILLAALIKSIEINHKSNEIIEYFIVEDGISRENKNRITNSIHQNATVIHWLPMKSCLPEEAKIPIDKSSLPLNIYTRLFIPHFIPDTVNKVIFLDVDMIVLEDISKLWHTDLENNIVGAVQDQFIQLVSRWGGVSNYKELGIAEDNKYFNAGLMVIDIQKWKAADITDKVIQCIFKNSALAQFQDQYGLNAVLAKDWKELDALWNRFAYSEDKRPFLIHFTGRKPIYKTYEFSEDYKKIFFEYLNQTDWKNFKPISETKRYFKKVKNILDKFSQMLKR